ncbi:unnamed protein product [Paramecium pentaurelia]|uniref:Transmembrane protein n=1 Tax=Paramecium pentaurelia TaxID=43138 RepID=A0A8S1TK29_9CILI|nr:unnamed protein product [Paramecium pentaurelia]
MNLFGIQAQTRQSVRITLVIMFHYQQSYKMIVIHIAILLLLISLFEFMMGQQEDTAQLQINYKGELSAWNETSSQWADKSCQTAPATSDYYHDSNCRSYFINKCTVSQYGQGCVIVPASCTTMTENQYYFNKNEDPSCWTWKNLCNQIMRQFLQTQAKLIQLDMHSILLQMQSQQRLLLFYSVKKYYLHVAQMENIFLLEGLAFKLKVWLFMLFHLLDNFVNGLLLKGIVKQKVALLLPQLLKKCANYFTKFSTKIDGGFISKSTCAGALIEAGRKIALNGTVCFWDEQLKNIDILRISIETSCKSLIWDIDQKCRLLIYNQRISFFWYLIVFRNLQKWRMRTGYDDAFIQSLNSLDPHSLLSQQFIYIFYISQYF